ncbi:hypothetical protein FO519_007917 [Halicephalobus sp. NKZ332]|nr:hypothetical protein FO519_007917 [Halicephalobus sp. NKZ332]
MYAVGWELKTDRNPMDITALNGVALYCELLNSSSYTNRRPITSGVGPFGSWRGPEYCEKGKVIVGFELSYWRHFIGYDDIGATDFTALCGNPFGSRDPSVWSKENNPDFHKHICPEGYAVNGIQTQVEEEQGMLKDDNGLNNVKLHCQKIDRSCTFHFKSLLDHTNSGSTPDSQSFVERVAYTHKSSNTTEKEMIKRAMLHAKISITTLIQFINNEISYESEKTTSTTLISMIEDTFEHEKTATRNIEIPPESRPAKDY